ncbi:unnamed protein product [Urochloa humidicola]
MALGDPDTRPEEETVFVPSSFDLERDARDWEGCTLVPWAMHLPSGTGAREIEELLLEKLGLERGDLTVTVHGNAVFIHIGLVEDYTAAASDLQVAVRNPGAFPPVRRPYVWHYGVEDGTPVHARPRYPARLPLPPREAADNHDVPRGSRNTAGGGRRSDNRGDGREARAPHRTDNRNCRDTSFVWPERRDSDDDDDYYEHPGRGGQMGRRSHQRHDADTVRRERTRSPRPRDTEFRGGRRRAGEDAHGLGASCSCLRSLAVPSRTADVAPNKSLAELLDILRSTASELRASLQQARMGLSDEWLKEATNFIGNLGWSAEQSGLQPTEPVVRSDGEAAWSDLGEHLIPISVVFDRIKQATAPSVAEVEAALCHMGIKPHEAAAAEAAAAADALPAHSEDELGPQQEPVQASLPLEEGELMGLQQASPSPTGPTAHSTGPQFVATHDSLVSAQGALTGPEEDGAQHGFTVDDLFATPAPPVLPVAPPPRAARRRHVFDMTALRRSARLASKTRQPPIQHAQRTLCRRLGLPADELRSIEEVLKDFISMFTGPLPEHIMAAMTAVFDLDNDEADEVNDALLLHAEQGVDDIQGGLQASNA